MVLEENEGTASIAWKINSKKHDIRQKNKYKLTKIRKSLKTFFWTIQGRANSAFLLVYCVS